MKEKEELYESIADIRIKHFWLSFKSDVTVEEFIDELENLCKKYAIQEQYYFTFE